jgi:hypothetical protein
MKERERENYGKPKSLEDTTNTCTQLYNYSTKYKYLFL